LFCFLKAEERGKDVTVTSWRRMYLGGCAAVIGVVGLEEDLENTAGGREHHWDPKMDWEGAGQEELLAEPTCVGGADFYVVLDTAGCLCMVLPYE